MNRPDVTAGVRALLAADQPPAVWERLAAAGFLGLGTPEDLGGSGGDRHDAVAVVAACAGLALPVAEVVIISAHLLALAGLPVHDGLVVPVTDPCRLDGRVLSGHGTAAWGRDARYLLVVATGASGERLCLVDATATSIQPGHNAAGEPRDTVVLDGARPIAFAAVSVPVMPQLLLAASFARSIQIAGALTTMAEIAEQSVAESLAAEALAAEALAAESLAAEPLAAEPLAAESSLAESLAGGLSAAGARPVAIRAIEVRACLAALAGEAAAARAVVADATDALPELGVGEWQPEPIAAARSRTARAATAAARIAGELDSALSATAAKSVHRLATSALAWSGEYEAAEPEAAEPEAAEPEAAEHQAAPTRVKGFPMPSDPS